jgi:hypothetical protein
VRAVIEQMAQALAAQGPLRVDEVSYSDAALNLAGVDWSLLVACPWQVRRGGSRLFAWDDDDAPDRVWDLIGHAIEEVHRRPLAGSNDPVFSLTGDIVLQVLADTDWDPWVLHLRDGPVFVGSSPKSRYQRGK